MPVYQQGCKVSMLVAGTFFPDAIEVIILYGSTEAMGRSLDKAPGNHPGSDVFRWSESLKLRQPFPRPP